MTTRRLALTIVASVGLVAAGCSSDAKPAAETFASVPIGTARTTTTIATATTETTATTATTATTEISTSPPTTPATDDGTTGTGTQPPVTSDPDPAQMTFDEVGSVASPTDITYRASDDTFYIVSKLGYVVTMHDGEIGDTKVLDIEDAVSGGSEQGLLGLTFAADGQLAYTDSTNKDGDTEIVEWSVAADGTFDPASRRVLLTIPQPFENHNGGQVRIGPDGYLYIGMGDGGSGGDPGRRALNTGELLGKLLRIDPTAVGDSPYSIPPDNPYIGAAGARPEIWSIGLRNPWRYSFDQLTNDLWIADVGQGDWEEIDVAYASEGGGKGENFGWSAMEGTHPFNSDQSAEGTTPPIWEYQHGERGCSISGGVRYRGSAIPSLYGYYVYADYCSGEVRALHVNDTAGNNPTSDDTGTAGPEIILAKLNAIAEVAQGPDGEIYVLSVDDGIVYALHALG